MTLPENILEHARSLDSSDPLRSFKERFAGLSEDLIYLNGNSLGPLPLQTEALMQNAVSQKWGEGLIRSWNDGWYDLPKRLGDMLAPVIGAEAGEVCFADSVTVNLFKLASAAVKRQPERLQILTDSLNFPSDYYALEGLADMLGGKHQILRIESEDDLTIDPESIVEAIGKDTALVSLSHVLFKSGFMHDLRPICEAAHKAGALTLIDLSHSVGSVPIDLNGWGVDMAVGCSYKYMNGGPGAPAFLFVRKDLQSQLQPQLAGWFGSSNPFKFDPHYNPADGIGRFLVGTPPILSLHAVEHGIRLLLEADMERIRAKSKLQMELLMDLYDKLLAPAGFQLGSPRNADQRGSHLTFRHEEAFRISKAMISPPQGHPQLIPDFRTPDNLRLGIAPLFLGFEDIARAAFRIHEIVQSEEYRSFSHATEAVT